MRTREMKQLAEKRMVAYAETVPQVRVRYHTVADGHKDEYALSILADVLNGRTGRLYKSLVLQANIANSASAGQDGRKYEGLFEFSGVAKPGHTPEDVEQAIYKEIEKLQKELVGDQELQKLKIRMPPLTSDACSRTSPLMLRIVAARCESRLGKY
ncbi:MAG: insulinase family protein [Pyrinomonadaceae bacterium]